MRIRPILHSAAFRVLALAAVWLIVVSLSHLYLNRDRRSSDRVVMGYMPVITNMAAALIDFVTRGEPVYYEALKFGTFSEMAEAFRAGKIQAAFIIAPLALALHEQGVPLKVVYIGNRHESTFVVKVAEKFDSPLDIIGKKIAVPIRYSGHYLAMKRYLREHGLNESQVNIMEVPPPEMPVSLASGEIDGYFCGEPFPSKALMSGSGKRFLNAESVWPKFICNLVIVREELIRSHPNWVQGLVSMAAKAGVWAENHTEETIKILSQYWGQDPSIVRYALTTPPGRVRFDLFVPRIEEFDEIAREMQREGQLGKNVSVSAMVEDRFAVSVKPESYSPNDEVFSIKREPGAGSQAQAANK